MAVAAAASLPLIAQATSAKSASTQADFTAAAGKYHVPRSVLMGVAHEVSGWQPHKGYNNNGGYGLAGLTDVTPAMMANGEAGAGGRADAASMADHPELHTVRTAAKLTGLSADQLKNDTGSNLMGEAALLASYQKKLTGGVSKKPSDWAGAVAKYSQIGDKKAAKNYLDGVYGTMKSGAKQNVSGNGTIQLPADPSARPATGQLNKMKWQKAASSSQAECPSTIDCTYSPVPVTGSNGQKSDRPDNGIKIDRIVIHTAEGSFDGAMKELSSKKAVAGAHYLMSSDGATTQLMPDKDIAFGVGNYHYNLHSLSIEHEGFSARGADWYTDAAYQQTAKLVTYLAHRFNVPLDRQHIIGHDNAPGSLDSNLGAQHWDPATAWDWNRFMRLLNAPGGGLGVHGAGRVGSAVTIAPTFDKNKQTYDICPSDDPSGATDKCTTVSQKSNSLFVRSAPSPSAPLFRDPVVNKKKKAGTNRISDWSDRVQAGQQFVVAGREGAWTAIWYDGTKGWIYNPNGQNTAPAHGVRIIKAAGSGSAPLYGQAYPAAKEYPSGATPSKQVALKAPNYAIKPGQAYVADQPASPADDFVLDSGAVVKGKENYYMVQFNNRTIYVNSADVTDSMG